MVQTNTEYVEPTTEIVVQTTVEPVNTAPEIVVETTTPEIVIETTSPEITTVTQTEVQTTTEPVETITETEVQTTTEPFNVNISNASEATTAAAEVLLVGANNTTPAEVVKDKLSEQIRKILKHYQRPDPVGFPGAPIPDPLSIPPMNKDFGMAYMTFSNMTVHGLSKFKVEHVNTDLKNMRVSVIE